MQHPADPGRRRSAFRVDGGQVGGQRRVAWGGAGQRDPDDQRPSVGALVLGVQFETEPGGYLGHRLRAAEIHLDRGPAQHVEVAMLDTDDLAVLHLDQRGPLAASFPSVTALEVAGEDDPGVAWRMQVAALMDVAQCPVVVAFGEQGFDAAGGVGIVLAGGVLSRGMQDADVQVVGHAVGIGGRQVLGHRAVGEGSAVQGDAVFVEAHRLRGARGEFVDIGRQCQILGDQRLRIVVAADQDSRGGSAGASRG